MVTPKYMGPQKLFFKGLKMGFNKRFLKKENILNNLTDIMNYLDADAVLCTDEFSRNVYRMFNEGKNEEEIINYINKNK